jgi:23S rRNA pseudouridine1911/1915/1917 synthase
MTGREDWLVNEADAGQRLDALVAERLPDLSRTFVKELIVRGKITVGGEPKKGSYRVKVEDRVAADVPEPEPVDIKAEDIPLAVLYEDEDIVVINKPQGMVVHPAHGHYEGTMVNALLAQVDDLSGINGELRPGIVHRLDKDTSGVLVVAKNDVAHRRLSELIKDHDFKREYRALVHGIISENLGTVDAPIGRDPKDRKKMAVVKNGRPAVTKYEVIKRYKNYTYLNIELETGRTHQIRVHMTFIGHPVVGDPAYGIRKRHFDTEGQVLHAYKLGFIHPMKGTYMEFTAPVPDYFEKILEKLNQE